MITLQELHNVSLCKEVIDVFYSRYFVFLDLIFIDFLFRVFALEPDLQMWNVSLRDLVSWQVVKSLWSCIQTLNGNISLVLK